METKKFNIFLSWHNDDNAERNHETMSYSLAVAMEYKNFIELVCNQEITTFFSAIDTRGRWRDDLEKNLSQCDYAIFIITDDAMQSGWIHVEYGAFMMKRILLKQQDKNDVFVVSELNSDNKTVIRGPIKDTQVFYPEKDTQNGALIPYKKGFLDFLSQIPGWHPEMREKFELYYNTFRERIEGYKDFGNKYVAKVDKISPYPN